MFVFRGLEEKWARAILVTMFPPDASVTAASASSVDLGAGFSEIVRGAPFEAGVGLRLAVLMVVLAPLFLLRRPRTFLGLDSQARERVLELLMTSSVYAVRQLMMALKTMGALLYARDRSTRERLLTPRSHVASGLIALGKKSTNTAHGTTGGSSHAA